MAMPLEGLFVNPKANTSHGHWPTSIQNLVCSFSHSRDILWGLKIKNVSHDHKNGYIKCYQLHDISPPF